MLEIPKYNLYSFAVGCKYTRCFTVQSVSGTIADYVYCLRLNFPVFMQLECESFLSVMLSVPANISFSSGKSSHMLA